MKTLIVLVVFASVKATFAIHGNESKSHEKVPEKFNEERYDLPPGHPLRPLRKTQETSSTSDAVSNLPPGHPLLEQFPLQKLGEKLDSIIAKLDEISKAIETMLSKPNLTTTVPTEPTLTEPVSTESLKLASIFMGFDIIKADNNATANN